ncbi:MAG: hypothetical protein JJT96_01880 [Opitutales bacterium]|nr:hypothetical protein [Opitutales bacterium]
MKVSAAKLSFPVSRRGNQIQFGIALSAFGIWFFVYHFFWAQPFYSYFSDPELPYFLNSVQLYLSGTVQMHEHPGTLLQMLGGLIAAVLQINATNLFSIEKIDAFRGAWRLVSFASIVSLIFILCKFNERSKSLWLLPVALLIFVSDYNTLAYLGTFTPEGAFFTIYLPVVLLFLLRVGQTESMTWRECLLWAMALGAVTTIKVTLVPISLFAWSVILARSLDSPKFLSRRTVVVSAILSFVFAAVLSVIFSENREGQLRWFFQLLTESGRYGRATEGGGAFLPFGDIIQHLIAGLSLQSFTLLIPFFVLFSMAVWDLFSGGKTRSEKIHAFAFIAMLLMSLLLFIKHPYQIKYLLTNSVLFLSFWCVRESYCEDRSKRGYPLIVLLLCGVVLNALSTHWLLHAYTKSISTESRELIDGFVETIQPHRIYFGSDISHPKSAKRFGVNWALFFSDEFSEQVGDIRLFSERSFNLRDARSRHRIALESISDSSLIVATNLYSDPRLEILFGDEEVGIFIYIPRRKLE